MVGLIKLKSPIGRSYNMDSQDVLNAKRVLRELGYYEEPEHGITPYPDTLLVRGIEGFQRDRGLRLDGVMKPGGETEAALQAASLENHADALRLQRMGRNGDTVLAHITPNEALMLKARGGSGTVNPDTGLLEFSTKTDKKGTYTWRTQGDGKVRGAHAERNGKVFSWDDPPEGGHPGEASNCRCRAEEPNCTIGKLELEEIVRKLAPKEAELSEIVRQIHNLEIDIQQNQDDISDLESLSDFLSAGGVLSRAPHPAARFFGYAAEITLAMVKTKIYEIEAELRANNERRDELQNQHAKLEQEVQDLRNQEQISRQAYEACMGIQ